MYAEISGETMAQSAPAIAESDVSNATHLDGPRRPEPERGDATDDAIRTAAKLAIDAGDIARATALLGMLDGRDVKPENVVELAGRRRKAAR